MSYFRTAHRHDSDVDISTIGFWQQDFPTRDRAFARLRAESPVSWHPPLQTPGLPKRAWEAGFWAVTTAHDVAHVSRHPDLFSSAIGQVSVRPAPYRLTPNMLVLDPPAHSEYRKIVGSAFTPKAVARLETGIRNRAKRIVLRAAAHDEFDFVTTVAAQMPLRTVAELIGVPHDEVDHFVEAADAYVSTRIPAQLPPGVSAEMFIAARGEYLQALCAELAAERRDQPHDDLMTALVEARVEGAALTEEQIFSTVVLLVVAGDDTTKQAITLSYLALQHFPDQREWLMADYDNRFDIAFDELVRYASPVLSFARTAMNDTELGGKHIAAGDKIALFYCSANRDETIFTSPADLDLARHPNHHQAFGGGGVHFCLGNTLARAQVKAILGEVLQRLPDATPGDPVFQFNDAVHAVAELPIRVR
ncbi:cytochrome P450 [Gryllotalpicola reticulitermitis]|uniref:Cytochrome P450 n=1 Tax=Gryllotalpicola reticulitermitis TaxID=1184153 RepID=A0ABV8Q062_9MICO